MKNKQIYFAIIMLVLAVLSCSTITNITVPEIRRYKTGETVQEQLNVPLQDSPETKLEIRFGAGELNIQPGAEGYLAELDASYNVTELKPTYRLSGDRIILQAGDDQVRLDDLPNFSRELVNTWKLSLAQVPIELEINAGAMNSQIELGGLSLQKLIVNQGASDFNLSFSEPNQAVMSSFEFNGGASNSILSGLGNANMQEFIFKGGAGDFTLDFSGGFSGTMDVRIDAGLGKVTIIVPSGVAAEVSLDRALTDVDLQGDWQGSGGTYQKSGEQGKINFQITMGAGELVLTNQ